MSLAITSAFCSSSSALPTRRRRGAAALSPPVSRRSARHRSAALEMVDHPQSLHSAVSPAAIGRQISRASGTPNTGSPLLHWTKRQTDLLQAALSRRRRCPLRHAGRQSARRDGRRRDDRAAASNASSCCRCIRSIRRRRPRRRRMSLFQALHDAAARAGAAHRAALLRASGVSRRHDGESFATSWRSCRGRRTTIVLSFHGIPITYAQRGDPYATHVKRTTFAADRAAWLASERNGRNRFNRSLAASAG